VNRIAGEGDVGLYVTEVRAEVRERGGSVAKRYLSEQPWLLDAAADVDVGDDCTMRVHQSRHERAEQPHVDAVSPDMPPYRILAEPNVLDDQLRAAAVLKQQRVER